MILAVDSETTGTRLFHGHRPFAVSMCDEDGNTYFYRWEVDPRSRMPHVLSKERTEIIHLLKKADRLVFHNSKFDIRALTTIQCWNPVWWNKVHDTLPMSHVLDSTDAHGLKYLSERYLGFERDDEKRLRDSVVVGRRKCKHTHTLGENVGWDYCLADPELLEEYAVNDVLRTIQLHQLFVPELKKLNYWKFYERERRILPVVSRMEETGVRVRMRVLDSELERYEQEYESKTETLQKLVDDSDFNPNSPKQLNKILFEKLGFEPVRAVKPDKDGNPLFSTDQNTLVALWEDLGHFLDDETGEREILNNKKPVQTKFLNSLFDRQSANTSMKYLREYRDSALYENSMWVLHGGLNPNGTATTRFSSSDPNMQNIGGDLRVCFGPRPGHFWIDLDYSNLELRLFAWLAGEKALQESFELGISIHMLIAEELHGKGLSKKDPRYKRTKNGNFALIYGASERKADATYGVTGAYEKIRLKFPGMMKFMDESIKEARNSGYVKTMFGYPLSVPEGSPYIGANRRIQGSAGDILKLAMLNLDSLFQEKYPFCKMVLTIHDEIVCEIPNSEINNTLLLQEIKQAMEQPGKQIGVPVPVSASLVKKEWSTSTELAI